VRNTPEKDAWLKDRLKAAVDTFAGGSADKFGRILGYTNGGYIREILDGKKPVRGAIIDRAHAQDHDPELKRWFEGADIVMQTAAGMVAVEVKTSPAPPVQLSQPKTFADLDDKEGHLVMTYRWLRTRGRANAPQSDLILQLMTDLLSLPDDRREAFVLHTISHAADIRYGIAERAADISAAVGAGLKPTPAHSPVGETAATGAAAPASSRTARTRHRT